MKKAIPFVFTIWNLNFGNKNCVEHKTLKFWEFYALFLWIGFFSSLWERIEESEKRGETMEEKYGNTEQCRMFYLEGERFKSNTWLCFFRISLCRENATKMALLSEVLKDGTKIYPSYQALTKQAETLYGAIWDISVVKKGGEGLLVFTLDVLKHIDGKDAMEFLCQLIREPVFLTEKYCEERLRRRKEILQRRIRAVQDDPAQYARKRCMEEVAQTIAEGVWADGYAEDLERITKEQLVDFYQDMLTHSPVCLFFCGDKDGRKMLKEWKRRLHFTGKHFWKGQDQVRSQNEPCCKREKTAAKQARLVMAFRSELMPKDCLYSGLLVWNEILGGSGNSLLFREIREKMGLCYEIHSFVYPLTGMLFVEVGAEGKDIPKIAKEISKIWDKVEEDGVNIEELNYAVESLRRKYGDMQYNPSQLLDFAVEQVLVDTEKSLSQVMNDFSALEKKDIQRVLAKTHLSGCFMLTKQEVDLHGIC